MSEKDPVRAQRLNEVYKHLFAHHGVESKTHLADILKIQRTGLAAAFGGSRANLTDNLFTKICAAFPGVFNLDYLKTGDGYLLTIEEEVKSSEIEKAASASTDAPAAVQLENMLEMYARMIRGVDDLRLQLRDELAAVQAIKADLQQARDDFRDATYRLTQALSRINKSDTSYPLMAAEQ